MGNRVVRPQASIAGLVRRLEFLQHYWKEIGASLQISQDTLQEIDEDCWHRSQKNKLERVIAKWIEENQCDLLLPQLTRALSNANFAQQDNRIQQRLNNLRDNNEENEEPVFPQRNNRGRLSRHSRSCPSTLSIRQLFIPVLIIVAALVIGIHVRRHDAGMDDFQKLLAENEEYVNQLLKVGTKEIHILVTGKTGTGKSALINGIIGNNVTEEGGGLDPTTMEVEKFERRVQGIPMVVFDSPGLQDGTKNEKEYLLDMEQKCKDPDLVLYTLRMSDKRLHTDDVEAMRKLTYAFGEQFWKNAMFVLTFANEVHDPEDPGDDAKNMKYFEEKLDQWEQRIPEELKKLNVPKEVAERIPVAPAGYYKQPYLPGQRLWFSNFWEKALNRMNETSSDGYSLSLVFQKDRYKCMYELSQEDLKQYLHEQPIVIQPTDSPSMQDNNSYSLFNVILAGSIMFILMCVCIGCVSENS